MPGALVCLFRHVLLEGHEELGGGGAGGLTLRVEVGPLVALEEAGAAGPAHGGQSIAADLVAVSVANQRGVCAGAVAAVLRIAVQDDRELLARDGLVGAEHVVAKAVNDAVLGGPQDRVIVVGAAAHVGEAGAGHDGLARETPQDGHEHAAAGSVVGREHVHAGAVHDALAVDVVDRVIEPVGAPHVGEGVGHDTRGELHVHGDVAVGHREVVAVGGAALVDLDAVVVLVHDGDGLDLVAGIRGGVYVDVLVADAVVAVDSGGLGLDGDAAVAAAVNADGVVVGGVGRRDDDAGGGHCEAEGVPVVLVAGDLDGLPVAVVRVNGNGLEDVLVSRPDGEGDGIAVVGLLNAVLD